MIRVCPERDARCPHGMDCPHSIDRYRCDIEASRAALSTLVSTPPVSGEVGELVEPVAWQWSDFSGKWYTVDTNTDRMNPQDQEELARSCAKTHEGRVRALVPASALTAANADRDRLKKELSDLRARSTQENGNG